VPELPEVEVVRAGLQEHIAGRRVHSVQVLHPRAVRRMDTPLEPQLLNARLRCASRRGKYLWFPFADESSLTNTPSDVNGTSRGDRALIAHLGMSGQLLVQPSNTADETHLRVRLTFDDGGPELRFVDQRTFGGLQVDDLIDDGHGGQVPTPVAHIARDPLDPHFDDDAFVTSVRARHTEIKRALLDQTLISGIGNIYADEALWRASTHGRYPTWRLSAARIRRILDETRTVMTQALRAGGTSFDALYVNVNGQSGYFDRSLHAYGQVDRPCARCGRPIRRERFMNRSSYSCPKCQRAPRSAS
jgi:formamidopyrimidine-DNA glycosylase